MARDTAENRAKDTFVLVRGDMNHASGAFAGGNIRANPALTIDAVEAWNGSKGFAFPLNIVAYLCANIFTELDAGFVMGVLNTENASFDPQRTRYESTVNDTSVGLMQIRVDTARWICSTEMQGMPDEDVIAILRDPVWNCAIGCKYLLYQTYRYNGGDLLNYQPLGAWVAAAYNAGSAIYNFQSKRFSNQDYVDSVAAKSLVGEWQ